MLFASAFQNILSNYNLPASEVRNTKIRVALCSKIQVRDRCSQMHQNFLGWPPGPIVHDADTIDRIRKIGAEIIKMTWLNDVRRDIFWNVVPSLSAVGIGKIRESHIAIEGRDCSGGYFVLHQNKAFGPYQAEAVTLIDSGRVNIRYPVFSDAAFKEDVSRLARRSFGDYKESTGHYFSSISFSYFFNALSIFTDEAAHCSVACWPRENVATATFYIPDHPTPIHSYAALDRRFGTINFKWSDFNAGRKELSEAALHIEPPSTRRKQLFGEDTDI